MAAPNALPHLIDWIDRSALPHGARLPAERSLAADLGVSRAELRKALAVLEAQGQVLRHVGQGTYVSRNASRPSDISSIGERTSPVDTIHARIILEPELARLAATRASARQLAEMRDADVQMRSSKGWVEYEIHDARMHRSIAEAAGNSFLTEILDLIYSVRRAIVWGRIPTRPKGPMPDYASFAEHEAILTAIEHRDGKEAAEAMRRHLLSTMRRVQEVDPRFQAPLPTN